MSHPETISNHTVAADAPWGPTHIVWRAPSLVHVSYEHCVELSDEISLPVRYGRSTFEIRVPRNARCDERAVCCLGSIRYATGIRSQPRSYALDTALDQACRVEIAAWVSAWIRANDAAWHFGQAIAAHNTYVSLRYQLDEQQLVQPRARATLGELLALVSPAVLWLLAHGDAAVRTWGLLHYIPHCQLHHQPHCETGSTARAPREQDAQDAQNGEAQR